MKKIINIAAWVMGIILLYGALVEVIKLATSFNYNNLTRFFYYISLGVIVFPPISNLINKSKNPKLIKVFFGSLLFISLALSAMQPDRYFVLKEINLNKVANAEKLRVGTEDYCDKHKKCPSTPGSLLNDNLIRLEDLNLKGHSIHDYRFEGTKSCAIRYKLDNFLAKDEDKTINVDCK